MLQSIIVLYECHILFFILLILIFRS
jgi:hypothetical protein